MKTIICALSDSTGHQLECHIDTSHNFTTVEILDRAGIKSLVMEKNQAIGIAESIIHFFKEQK